MRRHKAAFRTAVSATVLLIALAVFYTNCSLSASAIGRSSRRPKATQVSSFLSGLFEVSAPIRSKGEQVTARELLDRGTGRIE